MARSSKPRKRYTPRAVDPSPVDTAIALATVLTPQQQALLSSPLRKAFDTLRSGTGGWAAWCAMADGLNVAERLALAGICSDRVPEIDAAQAALGALHARVAERHTWTLYSAELAALEQGVFFHVVQLAHCTQGELAHAIAAVQRRTAQARAGNAARAARVCIGAIGA